MTRRRNHVPADESIRGLAKSGQCSCQHPGEIDAAFATLRQRRAGALLVGSGTFFPSRRQQIVTLAARDAIPAMYSIREYVEEGGLMSYGNDIADGYSPRWALCRPDSQGREPADLPVDQ